LRPGVTSGVTNDGFVGRIVGGNLGQITAKEGRNFVRAVEMGRDRFRAVVRAAEQRGFPKSHPLWSGRYWPAVQDWLDSDNGVGKNEFLSHAEDGPENFNAPAR
jgi:hypothetical protein